MKSDLNFLRILCARKRINAAFVPNSSPWPIIMAAAVGTLFMSIITYLYIYNLSLLFLAYGAGAFCLVLSFWAKDLIIESQYAGFYQQITRKAIRHGFLLFLVTEAMFFFALFWAYLHFSLSPSVWIGNIWPPYGFVTIRPFGLPLLNTVILVSSGITLTYAQKAIIADRPLEGGREAALYGMHLTIGLAVTFLLVQWYEFSYCWFSISDSVYGSIFFFITGFHGIHVIIGTIFLVSMYMRILDYHFLREEQTAFDLSAWYWHFVDVVWIAVYLVVYLWGGK